MLTICKASAGSGKTHRLTEDFIKMLFERDGEYKRILAVTFTNKATDEMKGRIVKELFNLADKDRKSDCLQPLMKTYGKNETEIRGKASKILKDILHDYSSFHISTIDTFFQQTLRAFTREIGMQGGYSIEMDNDSVLDQAIDNLYSSLDKPEKKQLLDWLIKFSEDKIENSERWNIIDDIKGLGKDLFKEKYVGIKESVDKEIKDKENLGQFRDKMYQIIKNTENQVAELGQKGLDILARYDITANDIAYGNNAIFSPLNKALNKADISGFVKLSAFTKLENNLEGYFSKKATENTRAKVADAYNNGLNDCVCGIIRLSKDKNYFTAKAIVSYFYTLGILTDLEEAVEDYRKENNVMMISDTSSLLSSIIGKSETPFIYEKIGTQTDHYMIDEFQDTSQMQWNNFLPLIKDSLANGFTNMIVGDIKQSIYRFRDSDWELLEKKVASDLQGQKIVENSLDVNWRSCRNIVEFNNIVFSNLPQVLQNKFNADITDSSLDEGQKGSFYDQITSAYKQAEQKVSSAFAEKPGHVKIRFLTKEKGESSDDVDEKIFEQTIESIQQLEDHGYKPKDICILVRWNRDGMKIADFLLKYREEHPEDNHQYQVITSESLTINSAASIRFLIAMLRYLNNPKEKTYKGIAIGCLQAMSKQTLSLDSFPEDITDDEINKLLRLPLYEMVESLYRLFTPYIPEQEMIFMQSFLDIIYDFVQKTGSELNLFLKWWNDVGKNKSITSQDQQDAIQILTIHKAKGLGFKAVIIPYCNWTIDNSSRNSKPILWCRPTEKPFNELSLIPINYEEGLKNTIFAEEYYKEKINTYIDSLNALYVAFTRAKNELIAFAPPPTRSNFTVKDCLHDYLADELDNETYEKGDWSTSEKDEESSVEEFQLNDFNSFSSNDRLRLRYHSSDFTFDDKQRKKGSLMHEILSKVTTEKDIPIAIEDYKSNGIISGDEADDMLTKLQDYLSNPTVSSWYDGSATVLNEISILFGEEPEQRPDRVMIKNDQVTIIDYKFGENRNEHYFRQVHNYLELIRKMGYRNVSGYLWYFELGKIEEVS